MSQVASNTISKEDIKRKIVAHTVASARIEGIEITEEELKELMKSDSYKQLLSKLRMMV